ncbi:hypothetical protein HGRIS_008014 [Hohenbuehelia grisea]|uniref:Rrp15p-domain-containing protein n=1 Tax=Hohenbuehelia grisea TaxID=104357 RepID=A0ABR3J6P8_9AGAR
MPASSSIPSAKRRKTSPQVEEDPAIDNDAAMEAEDDSGSEAEYMSGSDDGSSSADTSDEIAAARKSLKTGKRKRRATEPSKFGATLQALLTTDAPSALPLSLKPSVARKHNDDKLEQRAKKVLAVERKEKEEKGHITDVIGGWGGEGERALRKVAQRGVVKLFNLIQQSQASAVSAADQAKAERGSGKPSLPAPAPDRPTKRKLKGKERDNIIGRGKEAVVGKDDFFDIIRSGGIVSKA